MKLGLKARRTSPVQRVLLIANGGFLEIHSSRGGHHDLECRAADGPEYGVEFSLVFVLRSSLRNHGRITRIPSEL